MKILFVCLGNICRSPLAQGIAQHYYPKYSFDSAGLSGYHQGESPHHHSIAIARKNGIEIANLKSRKITYPQDDCFDYLICMDESNYQDLLRLGFSADKVKKLGSFAGMGDIPDPYYGGVEGFQKVYEMIKICLESMIKTLKESK